MLVQTQTTARKSQTIAWQRWSLCVPTSWNPVKVDGDFDSGSLLLADLHSPRLGLRWKRSPRRGKPADWAKKSVRDEAGPEAADTAKEIDLAEPGEWSTALLHRTDAFPGRDVFVAHSHRSDRLLQIVHHATKRSNAFADDLLPSLHDRAARAHTDWAMFDLSLRTPNGLSVRWYRFNAGDLALGLADERGKIVVIRQVGPAALALARQPLTNWLRHLQATTRKLYREITSHEPATLLTDNGRTLDGYRGELLRKRRLWWAWMVAPRQSVLAFHDTDRDRLITGQGADEAVVRRVLASMGWQKTPTHTEDD